MTRWARAGNSQKHKKMPGDPTSWEELSKGIKNSTKCKEKMKYPKSEESWEAVSDDKNVSNERKKTFNKNQTLKDEPFISDNGGEHSSYEVIKNVEDCKTGKEMSKRQLKKLKRGERKKLKTTELECMSDLHNVCKNVSVENCSIENQECNITLRKTSNEPINTNALSKKHLKKFDKDKRNSLKSNIDSPNKSEERNLDTNKKNINFTDVKKLKKKELFMKKLQERRAQNGITLLSSAAENRLYRIKKRLRQKGYTPEMIKDIIRKERRKAELEFRKTTFTKTCFNCGKPGHFQANCHLSSNKTNPGLQTCLKCGSTDHNSIECTEKNSELSSLTCCICKDKGHISKDCPDKKRSAAKEEPVVALHTINEGGSIDDDIIDIRKTVQKPKFVKPKVIVF